MGVKCLYKFSVGGTLTDLGKYGNAGTNHNGSVTTANVCTGVLEGVPQEVDKGLKNKSGDV